jgi:hypothetical protein
VSKTSHFGRNFRVYTLSLYFKGEGQGEGVAPAYQGFCARPPSETLTLALSLKIKGEGIKNAPLLFEFPKLNFRQSPSMGEGI